VQKSKREKDMHTSNLNLYQIGLPFLQDGIIPNENESGIHLRSTAPAQQDQKIVENHCEIHDSYFGICSTCKLFFLCKDLEFHKNKPAIIAQGDGPCPLPPILGFAPLSLREPFQECSLRLRLIKEKRDREAASEIQRDRLETKDSACLAERRFQE
jgi:hypothetical protein